MASRAHRGKRLRAIVAQSQDRVSVLHNYSVQSRDSENAQQNLEIAQIPRLHDVDAYI